MLFMQRSKKLTDIDLERIFIRRKDQISVLDTAISTWKHHIDALIQQNDSASEQYRCIVSISGAGGLGKSTLLRWYREELFSSGAWMRIGKIIDWSSIRDDTSRLRAFMVNDVYDVPYFEMMHTQLSESINQRLYDFKEYKKSILLTRDIEEKISNISRGVQKISDCQDLWKIPRMRMLKLFQWFATSGFYEMDVAETTRKVREYVGEDIKLDISCISYLHEEISQKLGEAFKDYLDAGRRMGTALGHDLRRFARERPLLILFDTYECIEKGSHFLKSVIDASGTRVAWFIAGRSQEWTNDKSFLYIGKEIFKKKKNFLDTITSIVLKAESSGSFSSEEIRRYFAQLRKQKTSLHAIKKADAQKIRAVTQGIPLAVSLSAQIYAQTGHVEALLVDSKGSRDIVERMVEQYLFYVHRDKGESIFLYGIAMQRRAISGGIFAQFAENSIDEVGLLKEQLRTTHTIFVEQDQITLHQEIRHFLRLWLLDHWDDAARREAATRLQRQIQERMDTIEKRYPDQRLDQRFEDDVWVNAYLDLIEIQFWTDEIQGFSYCLPFLLASIIYRRDVFNEVIAIGTFFRRSMTAFYGKQWDCVVQGLQHNSLLTTSHDIEQDMEKIRQFLSDMAPRFPVPFTEWRRELEGVLYWKRAECYRVQDRHKAAYCYQEAVRRIERSVLLREEAAYELLYIALDYCDYKNYAKGLETIEEALKIKFDFAEAYYTRGNIYHEINTYKKALIEYQYAVIYDEYHIPAHINLGNTYLILKRYQDAIEQYSKTLVLETDSALLYNNRASAYMSMGLYQEALADYCQVINLQPELAEAYTNRGTIYAHLHEYEAALIDYNTGYKLSPQSVQIAWMAVWANLQGPETLESDKIDALIHLEPDHYLAHVCRGISLALQQGEVAIALEAMELAIQKEPEEYDHYFWKGMIYALLRQETVKAQEAFEKALARGLPPLLLKPWYWLQTITPQFFEAYAAPLLAQAAL